MTASRYIGQRARQAALRKRQQAFLAALVDCAGSRTRAVEATGFPAGTVQRWQGNDPWFRARYDEIRAMLAGDSQRLRDELEQAAMNLALGKYTGLIRGASMRRVLEGLDEAGSRIASSATMDAHIRELLEGENVSGPVGKNRYEPTASPPSVPFRRIAQRLWPRGQAR